MTATGPEGTARSCARGGAAGGSVRDKVCTRGGQALEDHRKIQVENTFPVDRLPREGLYNLDYSMLSELCLG